MCKKLSSFLLILLSLMFISASPVFAISFGPTWDEIDYSFSASGAASIGHSGGKTFEYNGFDTNQFTQLIYAPMRTFQGYTAGLAFDGDIDNTGAHSSQGRQEILGSGAIGWGSNFVDFFGTTEVGTTSSYNTYKTLLRVIFKDLNGNGLNVVNDNSLPGDDSGYYVDVTNAVINTGGFSVWVRGLAAYNTSGTYNPFNPFYDDIPNKNPGGGQARSSYLGAFYGEASSQIPEPTSAILLGTALFGFSLIGKRRFKR